jgi:sugar O-acyltransferase (sialic acid O-acetyltransferase NeuD family)
MKNVIVWGASGHAKVIKNALSDDSKIIAYIDMYIPDKTFLQCPVYSSFERYLDSQDFEISTHFVIAIGGDKGKERILIKEKFEKYNILPTTVIHKTAWVDETAIIEEGAQILGMAAISAGVQIGAQTIINTNATIDHETYIGKGCHIMPAAAVARCVTIEDFCTVGTNATILPRLVLKKESIVGAGSVVTKNIEESLTVIGVPAKTYIREQNV